MNAGSGKTNHRWLPLPVGAALIVIAAFVALKAVRPVIPHSVILLYMGFIVLGDLGEYARHF